MPVHRSSAARSLVVLGLSGLTWFGQAGAAQANGFFEDLARVFAPAPELRYAQPRYVPVPYAPGYATPGGTVRRARRAVKVRHASLPQPAKVKPEETTPAKPTVREPDPNPVGKLMNDSTLRRGDIVVLNSGVKVFRGSGDGPHKPGDFEDVRTSKMLGDQTRRALAAMRLQTGLPRVADKADSAPEPVAGRAKTLDEKVAVTGSVPRDQKLAATDTATLEQKAAVTGSVPRKVGP